jgi:hypothetical protein
MKADGIKSQMLLLVFGLIAIVLVLACTSKNGPGLSSDSITYISVGKNLASGNGFVAFDQTRYHAWPPLFPLLIASFEKAGIDSVNAIRILNALLFGLMVLLAGTLFYNNLKQKILMIVGTLAVLLSPALLRLAMYLLTDFMFAFLVLLFITTIKHYARNGRTGTLFLSAIIAALAILTRYAGLALVLTGLIWLLFQQSMSYSKRTGRAVLFGFVAILPISIWITRNLLLLGTISGVRGASQNTLLTNFVATFQTIADWFIPSVVPPLLRMSAILIAMVIISSIHFFIVRQDRRLNPPSAVRISILFLIIYGITLICIATLTSIDTPDSRMLAPIYVPLVFITVYAVDVIIRYLTGRISRPFLLVIVSACAILVAILSVQKAYPKAMTIYNNGIGKFNKPIWRESELIRYLLSARPEGILQSNAPEAVYYYAGLAARFTPRKHFLNTPTSRTDDLENMQNSLSSGVVNHIIWFNISGREYLYDIEEMITFFQLEEIARFSDGSFYRVSQR